MDLNTYLNRNPLRSSQRPIANEDEVRLLGTSDGVQQLSAPPALTSEPAIPRQSGDRGCHLWVFVSDGIPYILETYPVAPALQTGKVKHSNLTGGGLAASGGELWVDPSDPTHLYINGCSGRYGPRTEGELAESEDVIRALGYRITSFGWDADADKPSRVLR